MAPADPRQRLLPEAKKRGRRFAADVVLLETDAPAGADEFLTVHDRDQLDRGFRRLAADQGPSWYSTTASGDHARGRRPPGHSPRDGEVPIVLATGAIRAALEADARNADPRPGAAGMTRLAIPKPCSPPISRIGMDVLPDRVDGRRHGQGPSNSPAGRAPAVAPPASVPDRLCRRDGRRNGHRRNAFFVIQRGQPAILGPAPTASPSASPANPPSRRRPYRCHRAPWRHRHRSPRAPS